MIMYRPGMWSFLLLLSNAKKSHRNNPRKRARVIFISCLNARMKLEVEEKPHCCAISSTDVLVSESSSFAWFIRTDKTGLNYLERVPFETDMQVDPVTGNLLVVGYERYSFGYDDPLSIWGSFPTA